MRRFHAKAAAAVEVVDANAIVVVLAESPDGSGRRLEIHRALRFDEEDRASGQDTYRVGTECGTTHYGGVAAWTLTRDSLELHLESPAARAFGASGFVVHFEPEHEPVLREGLQRVFG